MKKAASVTASAITAGAVPFATRSAAGDDDLSFILVCAIDLDGDRLISSGAELFSHVVNETTCAVIGGTGGYAGVEGDVAGTPSTVDGWLAGHPTFHLSRN